MKVINDLLGINNYKIVQDTDYFNMSLDSVLLCNFINIKNDIKIIDLCSGNCPIPVILSTKTNSNIIAVEIQKEIYELGQETININKLDKRIQLLNIDAKELVNKYETDSFDIITCNPPYFKTIKNSRLNKNDIKTNARHETLINIEDIAKISKKLLKNNGSLYLVHRPERLLEITNILKSNNLITKRIQFIYPKTNQNSNIILIEAIKNGNEGLKVEKPIIVHNKDGKYKKEILKIFEGK